ncbi:MAG: DUF1854 domain-containing protein, partial [Deltaproteobacteria bacterium]|nr:DUF1854 domain-containing protein [Deltaproteobacteria bacterium]
GARPLLRLLGFARPHAGLVALGLLSTLATTAAGLVPPYLTMPLVDEVLLPRQAGLPGREDLLALTLAGLLGAAALAWLLAWAQGLLLARISERVAADLRNRTFSHLMRLDLDYFGGKRTGDLIARLGSDTDRLCSFLSDTLIDFVTDVLMIAGTGAVLFTIDPLLAVVALVSFPVIAWLMVAVRERLSRGFLRGSQAWADMTSVLGDAIPGVRVVKAFAQEPREDARFHAANLRIVETNDRVNALWTFFWPFVALLNQLALLLVWGFGAAQVLAGRVTVGALTAFIAYIGRFYVRVESMSRILGATERAAASAARLFEILDRTPAVVGDVDPRPLPSPLGPIRFEGVSFRHAGRLVLDGVTLELPAGKLVGIVGETGSGKSTLANLLCRFHDPASGAITVSGVDLRRVPLDAYRRRIGVVLQDPFLFFGTVAENVAYGRASARPAEILAAARVARAHEFVLRLPEAYDSLVGERGQSLSGGERQRVAIARAVLVDPEILVLDEATSAVDPGTEREIQAALDAVVTGRTTLAIAHRLATLDRADLLVVLREGRVVESGPPAELLARGGEYARLRRAERRGGAVDADTGPAAPLLEPTPLPAPGAVSLATDDAGELLLALPGEAPIPVAPRLCFPLSDPTRHLCLVDAGGRERAYLADPASLPAASRALLEARLARERFLPVVEELVDVRHLGARAEWDVRTDRGPRRFVVDHEDRVRLLPDGRRLVTDSEGMRYVLPRLSSARARRLIARYG